jgi:hypothetical protein
MGDTVNPETMAAWSRQVQTLFEPASSTAGSGWLADDVAAMWAHQWQAPLVEELVQVLGVAPGEVPADEADDFGGLLEAARPSVALLRLVKDYAKALRDGGPLAYPVEVATGLYYAAVAVARVRCGEAISSLPEETLRGGFDWAAAQAWCPASLQAVFREAVSG